MAATQQLSSVDLKTITDVIPALVSFFDAGHVCRFANNYHRHWYGRTPEELIGRHMSDFLGPDGYAKRAPYLARVAAGELVAFDAKVPHLDGTARDASIRYVPRIGSGGFEGFYVLVFDTAVHQHRFRSVFEGTAVAFWELDLADGLALREAGAPTRDILAATRLVDFNAKAASLLGLDRERAVGQAIGQWWPTAAEGAFTEALAAMDRGEQSFEAQTVLLRASGEPLDVLLSCAFPPTEGPRSSMALGIVDLSDRIAREAALAELRSELAYAARIATLGELTASIAHEVNQPLGAVVNNGNAALRWLNRPEPAIDEVRHSLERVVSEAKRAADIIARTRALAMKGEGERVPIEPGPLARETAALVERELAAHGCELTLDIEDSLPEIHADRVQIQQVFVNLLVNATQAMKGQDRAPRIAVTLRRCPAGVEFMVEDNGPGLPPEKADQLFNAFYTTKATGMGIGLSVSKTIVEAHGGAIAAEPAASGGARFRFHIPSPSQE